MVGRKKTNGWMIFGIFMAVVVVVGGVYLMSSRTALQTLFPQAVSPQGGGTGEGGVTINTANPVINVKATDLQSGGTAVGLTGSQAFIQAPGAAPASWSSVVLGTDTAVVGQTVGLLAINNTQYHNAYLAPFTVASNSFPVSMKFNKNATVTENMYPSTGGTAYTNAVGGFVTNITALGAGTPYTIKDDMNANALTSTQDLVCLIEIRNGTALSSGTPYGVTLDGANPFSTSKPSFYTLNSSTSAVFLFNVAAMSDSIIKSHTITVNTASNKAIAASAGDVPFLIKTCYTKEWFLDPSGVPTYDYVDTYGALKSIAQYRYEIASQ
jgi:hypothetical protein